MLDKLKLFNKEKSDRSSKTQISKRTSSSSGFSSARSERSDSSLSLNNDQTPNNGKSTGIPIQNKKPEVASKTKSKLLASSTKSGSKDTLTKSKSDKKEKSPARMSADMSDSKIAVPKSQKSTAKTESKLKPISTNRKSMEQNRSDSKTNLSQIPPPIKNQSPVPVQTPAPAVNTGIPKPMAAIKGTTKNTHNQMTGQKSTESFNENIKCDKLSDISNQNNNISNNTQDSNGKMQIIAPILIENAVNQQQHQHQQILANHLQMQQAFNQQNISMHDSCHSKSTNGSSTGTASNSSESSGLIYRPSQSESGASDSMRTNASMSPTNKMILVQRQKHFGMQDTMIKAPSNGSIASTASSSTTGMSSNANKFNTVPTKQMQNGIIYEEEKQMTVVPMRPLLRGYNSHLTLPTRGQQQQQQQRHLAHEYNDDLAQGYCSDGDALRNMPVRYSDIENGYMSEGGGVSSKNGNGMQQKPMLFRARTQLPTTIEER